MSWGEKDVQLVPVAWLKVHEEIKPKNRDKLLEMTKKWGGYTKPLIVDKRTGAILDGHHRHSIAVLLNLKRVPAVCVDYLVGSEMCIRDRFSSASGPVAVVIR